MIPFAAAIVGQIALRAASAGAPPLEAAQFATAPGWHLLRGKVGPCPGVPASRCSTVTSTASTIRWRDCLDCLPHRTFAAMSAGDILIQVRVGVERPIRVRKTFPWPPRISRRQIAGLEGVPRRIGVYQGQTRVGTREVGVFAFFGRARPTSRQLSRANAELRRCHVG